MGGGSGVQAPPVGPITELGPQSATTAVAPVMPIVALLVAPLVVPLTP